MSNNFFAERLKKLRGTKTKAAFARFLGLSAPVYQRYEDGRLPRPDSLSVIAERCGVTIDWLLGQDDTPPPTPVPAPSISLSPSPISSCPSCAALSAIIATQARTIENLSATIGTLTGATATSHLQALADVRSQASDHGA